jgi:hypothetical protein
MRTKNNNKNNNNKNNKNNNNHNHNQKIIALAAFCLCINLAYAANSSEITSIKQNESGGTTVSVSPKNFIMDALSSAIGSVSKKDQENAASSSPTKSQINEDIKKETEDCAQNGIGAAIKNSMKIHQEIASIVPPVESLFDGDCFSGIMSLFDLSFAIPSLGSIMGAVMGAVKQFAMKKVCKAVKKASTMISDPINQALGPISGLMKQYGAEGAIENLVANKATGGLEKVDDSVGEMFISKEADKAVEIPNVFGQPNIATPVDIKLGTNNISTAKSPDMSAAIYNSMNSLSDAQKVMNQNQQQLLAISQAIQPAQNALQACNNSNGGGDNGAAYNCAQQQANYNNLIQQQSQLSASNANIQTQMAAGTYNITGSNVGANQITQQQIQQQTIQQLQQTIPQTQAKNSGASFLNLITK